MPTRIDKLSERQKARFTEWGDKWIEIGLRTGKADRDLFERAAHRCYEFAKLPPPKTIVWVSSPLVMALAGPIAALLLEIRKRDDAVGDAVGDAVIRKAISEVIRRGWGNYLGGQLWCGGWYWGGAYTSFFREVCALALPGDLWERGKAYEGTIQSACWWYPHKDFIMVVERPLTIHRELVNPEVPRGFGSHRLHNDIGPAVSWGDGWGVYAVHGVRVPPYIVEHPELITVSAIDLEQNAEIRRVMIQRYGQARYLKDAGAELVHELPDNHFVKGLRGAKLYRKDRKDDSPIVMIECLNSTPEPDGSIKTYRLRVQPDAYDGAASRDCHAAMASTWRNADNSLYFKRPLDYRPAIET